MSQDPRILLPNQPGYGDFVISFWFNANFYIARCLWDKTLGWGPLKKINPVNTPKISRGYIFVHYKFPFKGLQQWG